jgi:hypothetical protein
MHHAYTLKQEHRKVVKANKESMAGSISCNIFNLFVCICQALHSGTKLCHVWLKMPCSHCDYAHSVVTYGVLPQSAETKVDILLLASISLVGCLS